MTKYALFTSPVYSWITPTVYNEEQAKDTNYARISEWVEVEFSPLLTSEIVTSKVESLDKEIEQTKIDALNKILQLTEIKKELLALTAPVRDSFVDNNGSGG